MKMCYVKKFLLSAVCVLLLQQNVVWADSQSLFEQGIEAFKSTNYGSAELLFRKIIDLEDDNKDEAWFYLALSIFYQKKYKSAIFEFNRFLLICATVDLCNESRFWIAESYYFLKDRSKAIEEYKLFISLAGKKKPELKARAHERIGQIYYGEERYDEAILEWKKAENIASLDHEKKYNLQLKISNALFQNEKYDEAQTYLESLIYYTKDVTISTRAELLLGRIYQLKNMHKAALKIFKRIPDNMLKKAPFYNAQYYKGISSVALNDNAGAKDYFESFLILGKESQWYLNAKYQLGRIILLKDMDQGIVLLKDVLETTQDQELKKKVILELSNINLLKDQPEEAIPYLERALQISEGEDKKNILFQLGNAYMEVKKYNKAEEIFTMMIETYPYDRELDRMQFLLSVVHLKKGDIDKAIEGFNKINQINPFSEYKNEANFYLALGKYEQQDYDAAIKLFKKYLKNENAKKRYEALTTIMYVYIDLDNYKEAGAIADTIIKKYARQIGVEQVITDYVTYLYRINNIRRKYELFVLRNFPKSDSAATIYTLKGNSYFKEKQYEKAEATYTTILKLKGNEYDPDIFVKKAECLFFQEKYAELLQFLTTEKLELYDEKVSIKIIRLLAKGYYYSGQYEESYKYLQLLKDSGYDIDDSYMYFNVALQQKDIENAKAILNQLQDQKELYAQALLAFGNYYVAENDIELAKGYYSRIIIDYPGTMTGDLAKIRLAQIDIRNQRYQDAAGRLQTINSASLKVKQTVLLATTYMYDSREKEALQIVKKEVNTLVKEPEAEELLKLVVLYAYKTSDLQKIKKYGAILSTHFSGNTQFVDYYIAEYYYKNKSYKSAYYYYYKISQQEYEKKSEVLYKLGIIATYQYKNRNNAIKFFDQLLSEKLEDDEYVLKGTISLAILLIEKGNNEKAEALLRSIIEKKENVAITIQAKNLYEYYNFHVRHPDVLEKEN